MNKVVKVLSVLTGYGVASAVRIGKSVQESLQTTLQEIDERLLDWELPTSAQDGVLKDVRHTGAIRRGGPEGDTEHLQCKPASEI